VIVASVAVRVALLGRQSYWVDELFSVSQARRSFGGMLRLGSTEVHTPLYSALLWAWIHLGGAGEAWTRALSTGAAVLAVLVTHFGSRGIGLSGHVRWALTTATAAGGSSLVYSLDTRNYALLLLGSVGLTVATVQAAVTIADHRWPSRGVLAAWTGWGALASTVHLFGAVLTLAAAVVLAAVTVLRCRPPRTGRVLLWGWLAAAGCSLQLAWLGAGIGRPGFASGTAWIRAPRPHDVRDLLTTTFASGGLSMHKDGFAWTSPVGVLLAAAVCAAAALAGIRARRDGRRRRRPIASAAAPGGPAVAGVAAEGVAVEGLADAGVAAGGPAVEGVAVEGVAAAALLAICAVTVAGVFAVSQWRHLWTLRNLVVVVPALTWGVICLAAALAGSEAGRRAVATAVVALLGVGLVPLAVGLAHPYKADFRGVFAYLADVRRSRPDAELLFVGPGPPLGWGPVDGPLRATAGSAPGVTVGPVPVASAARVGRTSGTQVIVLYRGVGDVDPEPAAAALAARLDPRTCRTVPFPGLGVVRCG
jgi:hypothetical protein